MGAKKSASQGARHCKQCSHVSLHVSAILLHYSIVKRINTNKESHTQCKSFLGQLFHTFSEKKNPKNNKLTMQQLKKKENKLKVWIIGNKRLADNGHFINR